MWHPRDGIVVIPDHTFDRDNSEEQSSSMPVRRIQSALTVRNKDVCSEPAGRVVLPTRVPHLPSDKLVPIPKYR